MATPGEPSSAVSQRLAQHQAEAELAALVEHSADAVIGTTLEGLITSWNPAAERMYGWPEDEAIGQHIRVVAPMGLDDIDHVLARVAQGERVNHHEARLTRKDGSPLIASLSVAPVRGPGGQIIGAVTIARDVTGQRQAQEAIRRRDLRLNELIHTTQDAVIFIDTASRIQRFNASAERMFGYTQEQVLGRQVSMLMPAPYAEEHQGYVERYERTGEARAIGRIRTVTAMRSSGDHFPIELSVAKVGGDDLRYAAFIRDISDKVRLQEQLLERERLAAVGATAAVFAHEVGNPLNNMYLYAQLLGRRLAKMNSGEEARSDLDAIVTEVRRLNRLLDEFRSFYRSDRDELAPTDVAAMMREVCRLQAHAGQQTRHVVDVECELPESLPTIYANSDRLKQVLLNLCKNAMEAMPTGGKLCLRLHSEGDNVCIDVSDTGCGIEPEIDVFQPFRTTKPRGTGLGLPVVQQIITAHGGTITFESTPGVGTTFSVVLPANGLPPSGPQSARDTSGRATG